MSGPQALSGPAAARAVGDGRDLRRQTCGPVARDDSALTEVGCSPQAAAASGTSTYSPLSAADDFCARLTKLWNLIRVDSLSLL